MKNGFTLIELLIGILIAMLCMIMLLVLFNQISKISLESMQDAQYDSQVQTGSLIIQKLIQNAGYGSGRSVDIATGTYNSKPAIFWRFLSSDPTDPLATQIYKCEGLVSENELTNKEYKLYLLSNANTCGKDTNLTNAALWNNPDLVKKSPLISIKNPLITTNTDPIFKFSVHDLPEGKNCTPYGISENNPAGYKYVVVNAKSKNLAIKDIQQIICLNNIFRSVT